jgi:hypothetical protein
MAGALLLLFGLLALAGCATTPMLVMVNPRSGVTVDCNLPDPQANSGDYLVSRACLSACQAHGFRPVPGVVAPASSGDIPAECMN